MKSVNSERSEFTSVSIALARALVIGPLGVLGDGGMSMGITIGCRPKRNAGQPSYMVQAATLQLLTDIVI